MQINCDCDHLLMTTDPRMVDESDGFECTGFRPPTPGLSATADPGAERGEAGVRILPARCARQADCCVCQLIVVCVPGIARDARTEKAKKIAAAPAPKRERVAKAVSPPPKKARTVPKSAQAAQAKNCEYGRQRNICKECGGKDICQHGRQRNICKECGGKGICITTPLK